MHGVVPVVMSEEAEGRRRTADLERLVARIQGEGVTWCGGDQARQL